MLPSSKAEALKHFESVWAEKPEHDIGLSIIEYLTNHLSATTIPISVFFDVATSTSTADNHRAYVLSIVNYFSGEDLHLLTAEVELIVDEEIHHLTPEEIFSANAAHINPLTGEYDPELKEKLFLCFTPSPLAKKVLGE
jgi:hypothetical protein